MPQYEVEVPGYGKYRVESPTPLTDDQAYAAIQDQLVKRPEPQGGFLPAAKAGLASLKGDIAGVLGRTGLMDVGAAEKYRAEQEAYRQRTFKPTEEGWTEAPGTKIAELLGGSVPYMAAPLVVGGGAALAGAPALVGAGAAGLASAGQFVGSNLSRQVEEGASLAKTDLQAAALAAVPQAALDMVGFRMVPGIRRLFGAAGAELTPKAASEIAKQGVKKIAADYTLATGKAMTAEGLTEAGQQVFERLQAGLNITDPQARQEYFDSFIGGAVLGGALAPAGRYMERGREQAQAQELQQIEAAKAAAAQAAKEQAALAQPAYAQDLKQRYTDANIEMQRLNAVVKELGANKDPLSVEDTKDAKKARDDYAKTVMQPLVEEIRRVRPLHPGFDFRPTAAAPAAPAAPTTAPTGAATSAAPETKPGEVAPETATPAVQAKKAKAVEAAPEVAAPVDELEVLRGKRAAPAVEEAPVVAETPAPAVEEAPVVAAEKKPRAKKAKAEVPAVEDTTVEPTEPKTLEEAFQPTPIEEEPRTDEGQLQIPGTEPPTKQIPLTRTGSGISPEALRDVQAELKRLSKEFISARQEGRKNDARAILERMRYLRSQGVSDEMGPQIRGAIEVPGTQTLTTPPTSPTSTAGIRAEISRIQSTVDLTEQQAALLDRIDDNLSSLSEYRPEITAFLTSLRQRRPAPEVVGRWHPEPGVEQFLQQQVAAIEQKAQQQVTPRELNGMLAKTAKLPLSGKERGLLKLIGENQSPIMGDAEARRIVANWLIQDVGQGVGAATDTLRSYFGIAQEQKAQVSPLSKSVAERSSKINTEYEAAKQALEKANVDAGVPLQALGSSVQRIETQVARAQAAVRAAEDKVNTATTTGAKKVAATGLANRQNALNELTQKLAAANKDYREQQQKLIAESPQVKAASERFEKAREPKRLLDTVNTSDSAGARQDARNALNELMPLPKTEAGVAREKVTAPAVQTDMFAEELAPAQVEKTVEEGRVAQREATKKSEEREEEARKKRERESELAALPGQRMSFEKRQEMLRKIDEAPLKRQALQDRANDGNLSQEERDAAQEKLTAYLEDLRQKAEKKDKTYGTKYRIRGEKSALVQELKTRLEATDLTEAQRNKLQERYRKVQRELVERDNELARLRGVEISPIQTPEQRLETLERLHRETYGQAVSDEQQELLDKTKGRALGPVARKELQPAKVFYTGEEGSKDETEKRTYTRPDMRLTEARGQKQRDVPISKQEMKEANKYEQYRKERRSEQEQALLDYKNQVNAAASKISDLNTKLNAVKERQAALEKQRTTEAEAAAGVRTQWTKEKAAALNEQQESIQKELDRAKDDLARLANQEADAAKGDVIDEAQRAELKKYEDYLKALRKRVPTKDRKRVLVMYRGVRTPAEEVIAKVSETVQRLKEDLYGSYYGETGKTKLSKEARAAVKKTELAREENTDFAFRDHTPLTGTALEAVQDGRIGDALDAIGQSTQSPFVKELVQRLRPLILRTKLRVQDDLKAKNGKSVAGLYDFDSNTVFLDTKAMFEEDFLHELVHAVTERALVVEPSQLTEEQRTARAQLEELFHAIQNDKAFADEYGKLNVHEFAAEVMSNPQLRDKLSARKWKGASLLNKIYRAFMKLIGLDPDSMAGASTDAVYKLFNPSTTAAKASVVVSPSGIVRPSAVRYAPGLEGAGATVDKIISKERGAIDKVRAAAGGWLGLETQFVDRFAGFERLSKTMDSLKGMQMMYYLRMYDQKMNFTAQSVSNGALQRVEKKRGDGRTEYVIESVKGANIKQVVDILKKAPAGSPDAANRLFSLYLAGIRAANKGFDTLHFGSEVTEAQLRQTMADIRATPGLEENFKKAREVYNEYNRNQMNFLAQSGAISKELAARLTQENDYIPFYREQRGAVELLIGGENPIRIGNLTEQPYLHELVGGDRPILDFLTSSVQNTAMITDMALRNLSTRNAAIELSNMKLAQIREGRGADDRTTVRYKVDGKDFHAIIDTDKAGIPADILVKGMQGIPTQMPAAIRMLGLPAKLLRTAVQVSPLYPARQLFRDSLAATVLSGADFMPVLGSLKEIGKSATKDTLERRGITGGQIITGTSEDMSRILKDMLSNRGNLGTLIAKAEALNMEADAATRRAQYNSYIKQGLSEMEATLMSLESMNFNKRGASPSIHMANALIPFFNSQIQGLNVLYKALTGKLPFNERLKIQEKLITRGLMIAAGSLAYAALMQDDEAYKNATPDQKYGNWFVRLPGVDEPVRVPIPFEIGYIFKALPEALYNSMANEHGSEEAFKAMQAIVKNTIPGGSSYLVPQAMKPLLEYGFEKSFYTGRDTLSAREKQLLPEQQFRENTTELAKMFGGLGLSPIKVEELVRGYTGTMGLALMQAVDMGIPAGESPEKTAKRLSNYPVVGGAFQPNDAGGIINAVYEKMLDAKKVQTTVERLTQEGRVAEARELVQKRGDEFAQGAMADYYIGHIRQITALENAVRASNMTGEEKRAKLDETRQMKIKLAEAVRKATDEVKKAA